MLSFSLLIPIDLINIYEMGHLFRLNQNYLWNKLHFYQFYWNQPNWGKFKIVFILQFLNFQISVHFYYSFEYYLEKQNVIVYFIVYSFLLFRQMIDQQHQYQLTLFVCQVRIKIQKFLIYKYLILFFQTVWILILIIQKAKTDVCKQIQLCNSLKSTLENKDLNNKVIQIMFIIYVLMTIFKIIQAGMFVNLSMDRFYFKKNRSKKQFIIIISIISYWISQVSIYPATFYVLQLLSNYFIGIAIIPGIIIVLSYNLINCTISSSSLYSQFTSLIVVLIWFNENIYAHSLLVMLTIYIFFLQKSKINKVVIALINMQIIVDYLTTIFQEQAPNPSISLFYLTIMIALLLALTFYFGETLTFTQKQNLFPKIIEIFNKTPKNQKIINYASVKQLITIFDFLQKKLKIYNSANSERIIESFNKQVTASALIYPCEQLLKKICQAQSQWMYKFNLMQMMITNNKSLAMMLKFLHSNNFNITKMNIQEKITYVQLFEKIQNNYGYFKQNKQLQVLEVDQYNFYLEKYQSSLKNIITSQISFWQTLLQPKINKISLQQKFRLLQKDRLLTNSYKKNLQQYHFDNIFFKIHQLIERKLIQYGIDQENQHQQNQEVQECCKKSKQFNFLKSNQNTEEDIINSKFIILNDSRIQRISSSLASQIQVNKASFKDEDWIKLFGDDITQYLMQIINYMSHKNQNQPTCLPIYKNKYCFVASIGRILWFPAINGSIKYMIKLQTLPRSYLFYNIQTNIVSSYNPQFITNFNIQKDSLNLKIQKDQTSFERLFSVSFSDIFLTETCSLQKKHQQIQKQTGFFQFSLNLTNVTQVDEDNFQQTIFKILMRVYDYIYIGESRFAVLELKPIRQASLKSMLGLSKKKIEFQQSTQLITLEKSQQNINIYERQTFFCPITNSYEIKIKAKFASLKHSKRFRHYFYLVIIAVIIFFFSIFQSIVSLYMLKSRNMRYDEVQGQLKQISSEYLLLYKIYENSLKRYQFLAYPENVLKSRKTQAIQIIQSLKINQRQKIQQFQRLYLKNIKVYNNQGIEYNLIFQNYNISANSQSSTLFDFSENFQNNIQNDEYEFILKNYLSFRNLTTQFQNSLIYTNKFENQQCYKKVVSIIITILVILLAVGHLVLSIKINLNKLKVLLLFNQMTNQEIQIKIQSLRKDYKNYFDKKEKQKKLRKLKKQNQKLGQKNTPIFPLNCLKYNSRTPSLFNNKQNLHKNMVFAVKQVTSSSEIPKQQRYLKKALKQPEQRIYRIVKKVQKKTIYETLSEKYLKYSVYLMIIAFNITILIIELNALNTQISIMEQFFNFQKQLYKGALSLNKLNCDTYIKPIYLHMFQKDIQLPIEQQFHLSHRFQSQTQFQQIKIMTFQINSILESNLCAYPIGNQIDQFLPCQKYMNGVLKEGYSQGYNQLLGLASQLQYKRLQEFENVQCNQMYCPLESILDFLCFRLNSVLQIGFTALQSMRKRLNSSIKSQNQSLMTAQILGNLSLAIIMIIFLYQSIIKSCNLTLQMFKIFPKNVITKMRITNYLKKNKILDLLDLL